MVTTLITARQRALSINEGFFFRQKAVPEAGATEEDFGVIVLLLDQSGKAAVKSKCSMFLL